MRRTLSVLVALACVLAAAGASLAAEAPVTGPEEEIYRDYVPQEPDPLLKQAWDYYWDIENRSRQVSIELFEKYLDENPESPHRPEIYARIGMIFIKGYNTALGETSDMQQALDYLRMAHEGYDEKMASMHLYAWSTLANFTPGIAENRRYYDWLCRLRDAGTADDFYPFRPISSVMLRIPAELDSKGREEALKWARTHQLLSRPAGAMQTIVMKASNAELEELIRDYAGTAMADKARAELDDRLARITGVLNETIIPDLKALASPAALEPLDDDVPDAPAPVAVAAPKAAPATPDAPAEAHLAARPWLAPLILALCLCAVAAVVVAGKMRRARGGRQRSP